jgi:ribose/xylose/arabinose/galactoside ABC-type transport system permease subunit
MPDPGTNLTEALPRLREKVKPLFNIYTAFILLVIIAAFLSPTFLMRTNIFNVLRQASALGILSVGMTFVILSGNGGVDLSVGAVVSLTTCLAAGIMMNQPEMVLPAVLAVLAAGLLNGLFNGALITRFKTDPFITTLGTMTVTQGLAMYYTKGSPFGGAPSGFRVIAEGYVGFVPIPVIIFLTVFAIGLFVLRKTVFGRYIYAIGGNQEVARLSGIRVNRYKVAVYVISSMLAVLAGLIMVARVSVGDPKLGYGFELDAIAATIIGGTSFAGGVGGMGGTIIGVMIIAIMNNLLNLLNVSPFLHGVVKGLIILAAIIMQRKK